MHDPGGDDRGQPSDDATVIADDATEVTGPDTEGPDSTGRRNTAVATAHTELDQYGPADESLRAGGRRRIIKERFVLDEPLGKGGMGQVFKALDLRKQEAEDDRPYVAIKFLGEAFSRHPKALISLQREAKKTQELAHPNIVTVYDFDRDGTHVYMTMELLDGAPLSSWDALSFEGGEVPSVESMVIQLAEGLAYAHSKGFVHSDLKPDNVFITRDGRIKILDFGIARIADAAAQQDSFDAGQLGALTRRYASLEMLERGAEPHPADDIYALGIIAYQLYSGEHPFGGASAQEAFEQGLQPSPLKGVPGYRQQAIERALRLRRADRTASAEDFLATFSGARRKRRALVAGVTVLLVSSLFFGWLSTREAGPSVPFSELPAPVQAELTRKLEAGQQSLEIGDWDGASRYFMDSWELHPRNPDAKAGLARIVEQLEARVDAAGSQRERELLLRFADAYAEHPYFAENRRFRELREELAAALE
jgi:serine/threonine protein kinase